MATNPKEFPERFIDLKRQIVDSGPKGQGDFIAAWNELLRELAIARKNFKDKGSEYIPQVEFEELNSLTPEKTEEIKKCGCVVVKNVVDDEDAIKWKEAVKDYISANPSIPGFPEENKQFFHMYWSKSQVKARSHPNVLATQNWLNSFYRADDSASLKTPLVYADRLRIRQPGPTWEHHPPHVDGGAIERWEDPGLRNVFDEILKGNWKAHDPYDLEKRLKANSNIYGRPGQARWLALSDTRPNEGTIQFFPDVKLSNAYLIMRPFFRLVSPLVAEDPLDEKNWEFDVSYPDFPGITYDGEFFFGPRPTDATHPHLKVSESMISVPHVKPGDMVFWHCDLIHAVEFDHKGMNDSSVMYIPAAPGTPKNWSYIERQKEHFLRGAPPPDFPQNDGEIGFKDLANEGDFLSELGKRAMGLGIVSA
ncbi:DUF1479-domain-containing protein [Hysterangium stoloniferum]|nr:DUF1479-domain-containing protein [Hysterangium stoloniferum]